MIKIDYPPYQPKIKKSEGRELIFDAFRKRWVALTPEEWVRQNFLQFLVEVKKYPPSLIAIEKEITVGELKNRFDIVVYDRSAKPFMIIECKEMNVALDAAVINQVLRYNSTLQVPFLVITNGTYCFAFLNEGGQLVEIDSIPSSRSSP